MAALSPGLLNAGLPRALPIPGQEWSLNPLDWLGKFAVNAVGDTLITLLSGVWSAGLWLLKLAFLVIDKFATPDVSAAGPLQPVLPVTLWLGGFVAVVMLFVQVGLALVRRDGQSIGRILLGIAQYGLVCTAFLSVAAAVIAAGSGLERGILSATLHVDTLAAWDVASTWPREAADVAAALVLAITALLLVIPAAFADVLIALVRDAALIVLVATAPISAAGLVSDVGKAWFWKSLRWFISAVAIAPLSALVLGIGVGVSKGVVSGAGDSTAVAVGTAVVGAVLIMVAAVAPLVLFRLLAFVEPSTVSGAAMRQAWADAGGLGGLFGRGQGTGTSSSSGTTAAAAGDGAGRSQGEATAQAATASRLSSVLGVLGQGMQLTTSIANRAVDLGTDVLGSAGVGHPGYSMTPADERALRASRAASGGQPAAPQPPAPPAGPAPGSGTPAPTGTPGGAGGSGGAGGAAAGAGEGATGAAMSAAEAGLFV